MDWSCDLLCAKHKAKQWEGCCVLSLSLGIWPGCSNTWTSLLKEEGWGRGEPGIPANCQEQWYLPCPRLTADAWGGPAETRRTIQLSPAYTADPQVLSSKLLYVEVICYSATANWYTHPHSSIFHLHDPIIYLLVWVSSTGAFSHFKWKES